MHEPQLNFRLLNFIFNFYFKLITAIGCLTTPVLMKRIFMKTRTNRLDNEKNDESILNMIIVNDDQSKTALMVAGC